MRDKSMVNRKQVWLVRAGGKDEGKPLFLDRNTISLGPSSVGDLSKVSKTREAFKAAYRIAHPDATPTGVGGAAGQLFRLVYEAMNGDYVIYPSKDGEIHIGVIKGNYKFSESHDPRFPHRRKVQWLSTVTRDICSHALLNEARAFKTFYGITKNCDEVVRLASASFGKN
jgi:restriction system protein